MLKPMKTSNLYWLPVVVSTEELYNSNGARLEKIHFRAHLETCEGPLIYCEDKTIPFNKQIYPLPDTISFLSRQKLFKNNNIYVNLMSILNEYNIDIGLDELSEDDKEFYQITDSTYYVHTLEHYINIIDFIYMAAFKINMKEEE